MNKDDGVIAGLPGPVKEREDTQGSCYYRALVENHFPFQVRTNDHAHCYEKWL